MGHEDSEVARVTRGARRRDDVYSGSCHRDFRPNPESVEARRSPQALGARLPGVDLDALVGDWLTVPDLCERLGLSARSFQRRLAEERQAVVLAERVFFLADIERGFNLVRREKRIGQIAKPVVPARGGCRLIIALLVRELREERPAAAEFARRRRLIGAAARDGEPAGFLDA